MDDKNGVVCYTFVRTAKKEAFSMENKPVKTPVAMGLLAHV
jgi:hypothetical protein